MPFEKTFKKEDFLKALSKNEFQTTSQIAKKVGCSRYWAEQELSKMGEVEMREKKVGGRFGFTKEWKLKE